MGILSFIGLTPVLCKFYLLPNQQFAFSEWILWFDVKAYKCFFLLNWVNSIIGQLMITYWFDPVQLRTLSFQLLQIYIHLWKMFVKSGPYEKVHGKKVCKIVPICVNEISRKHLSPWRWGQLWQIWTTKLAKIPLHYTYMSDKDQSFATKSSVTSSSRFSLNMVRFHK